MRVRQKRWADDREGWKGKDRAWKKREKGGGEENGGDYGNKGWSLRGISLGRGEGK